METNLAIDDTLLSLTHRMGGLKNEKDAVFPSCTMTGKELWIVMFRKGACE